MLQNARGTAFTTSELLRENQIQILLLKKLPFDGFLLINWFLIKKVLFTNIWDKKAQFIESTRFTTRLHSEDMIRAH